MNEELLWLRHGIVCEPGANMAKKYSCYGIRSVLGRNVNLLGCCSVGHSQQRRSVYELLFYSERSLNEGYLTAK